MVADLDLRVGQLYSLELGEDAPVLASFAKEMIDGRLKFIREGTDLELYIELDDFEKMRSAGEARRIPTDVMGLPTGVPELDPLSLLDPDDPNITARERQVRLRQQQRLHRARTLRFYCIRHDKNPGIGLGRVALRDFIADTYPIARQKGYAWKPSPSTLQRALANCGAVDERPLTAFFKERQIHNRAQRWHKDVVEAADRAIELYWGDSRAALSDAIHQFTVETEAIREKYSLTFEDGSSKCSVAIPCEETMRLWIKKEANWWTWAKRYGVKNANRRFAGRGRAIEGTRPLEYVMIDHTQLDAWAVLTDEDGEPILVARPWLTLAIDTYSRMVVGAVLGYEPPSLHSVSACLRHIVRRKDMLIQKYGAHKGATDGWGKPSTIIVDNGKEFVSPSFQSSCEAAGIDVIWAPVRNPMFKPYVERLFKTFNDINWHKLPGGIPLTPQQRQELDVDPQAEAVYTRGQLEDSFWNAVVTLYHVETHSGIDMAPALKWRRGIATHKRPTVDDVSMLDKLIGKAKQALLSAEGVTVDGHRFHDGAVTTALMNRLVYFGKERRQRRSVSSSRTVPVRVSYDPGDVSKIHVWDPTTRTSVALPNWHKRFAGGLSWFAADKIKEFAKARNLAFHSDAEKAAARVAHRDFLFDIMPNIKALESRRRARFIEPMTELAPGETVKMVPIDDNDEIVHDTAARRAKDPLEVKKGRPFGGKAGARKAAKTRAQNRKKAEDKAAAKKAGEPTPQTVKAEKPSVDTDAILARVRGKMKKSPPKGDEA